MIEITYIGRRWADEDIIRDYVNGVLIKDIAKKYGISEGTVNAVLSRNNIERNRKKYVKKEDIGGIIEDYLDGYSTTEIARKYGYSEETIRKILLNNGVILRDAGKSISLIRNRSLKIDYMDENLAYVLGVIESDGYVERNRPYEIGLSVKDLDFVNVFAESLRRIGFKNIRFKRIIPRKKNWSEMYRVSVMSRIFAEWYYSLKKYEDYEKMFGDDEKIIGAFLRGVFDGDGGCYLFKRNGKIVGGVVYFVNTNMDLIDFVSRMLDKLGIEHSIVKRGNPRNGNKKALRINIKASSKCRYRDLVGFSIKRKQNNLEIWCGIGGVKK